MYVNYDYLFRPRNLIDNIIIKAQYDGYDTVFAASLDYGHYWIESEDGNFTQTDPSLKSREKRKPTFKALYGLGSLTSSHIIRNKKIIGGKIGIIPIDEIESTFRLREFKKPFFLKKLIYKKIRNNMKILGITLARGGSKSVPLKNIRPILKKPLIYYTIKEAKKSKLLTDYIVSTDHKRIFEISKKYGASVPFIRPTNLSRDNTTSVASLQHAVNFMEKEKSIRYDFIVEIMCTNPLKKVVDIDNCIKKNYKNKS